MQMGGILNHAILAPTGGSIAYYVNVVANITYAAIRGNSIGKGVSAAVSWASAAPKKDIVKTTITALVDYSASVTKAITITAPFVANISFSNTTLKDAGKFFTINMPIGVTYLRKDVGKFFEISISWGTAVRLATRFITDLNILQLPVNAVLAHKYLFKKGGDTVEKRDPFYKFERMASRRTGVRRLNRGDGPSFTTKTDKKGYD